MSVPYNSVAIIGTTASGKTAMACALAHRFGGGIISLDARQMYKGFNLCSGKDLNLYTKDTVSIPYRLIDICNPEQKGPVQDWMQGLQRFMECVWGMCVINYHQQTLRFCLLSNLNQFHTSNYRA